MNSRLRWRSLTRAWTYAGQQAQGAMALVLVITGEGRVDAGLGRQIRRRRCDGLDSRLFVVGDDRYVDNMRSAKSRHVLP